ncbi:histidine triad nucleotide-binding protein [Candidatus Berkelbacteria bacterium CG_4_10_14_0_8_um_filter_35_9_33_8]|uniref:Histidine triad nucleotide-binding protein n=1 Tax=Candidatus Berkelbacteria bacterium CG_4_10_14_0_2_um_filter_35_9_33_12 TaxID=1974499 RepID=A0A2M7W4W7_9BACT|nr:MAG: histidine triad nucleotide-binding protein [Candidatus Berkelbacteria bacterium CG23_combo_of_CG06-09_8_20_14_all_33_15]PIS08211.1 MAG: histidine triad nucleotide-binding protein [Candidatus Berkelbacteria bacterium CG10_big_fil_rev_8_21_14_0_10_33_10]PIZ28170.1 MAG: histidine triad nucleotide-binding protein [Candidatus Berkelbacteria bacterium CG_4_10_14_0_8_um_filter_35_9_33_8]PJA20948.1 MAG: histidine triad nucleotide-binding protein [Candidatus Berkelbacteria bacterium CG_4_10_14_0_
MSECVFCKIANRLSGSDGEYHFENDQISAFNDINPQAPIHILIVPKRHIPSIVDIVDSDIELLGKMVRVASELAKSHHLNTNGYRLVFNIKKHGGQVVDHIHLHLLGGQQLGKMNNN